MKKIARSAIVSLAINLLLPAAAFAQSATQSAKGATQSSLPNAGNPTVTAILVGIALVLILVGATRFFSSYR